MKSTLTDLQNDLKNTSAALKILEAMSHSNDFFSKKSERLLEAAKLDIKNNLKDNIKVILEKYINAEEVDRVSEEILETVDKTVFDCIL